MAEPDNNPLTGPAAAFGQGSAGLTDLVTAIQGIVRQLSTSNESMPDLIAAIGGTLVNGYTVSTLPSATLPGQVASVTDGAAALAWGAPVVGGGTTAYLVWWNGVAWTVVGK